MRNLNILDFMVIFFGTVNLIRMALLLIGSDWYGLKFHFLRKKRVKKIYQPIFSVIIPAHNEQKTIIRAIKSVHKNTYPQSKVEIIVVDDGSTDNTYQLAEEYRLINRVDNLTIIKQANTGKAQALNNGIINYSRGELIMCLDSDSMIAPDAIEKAIEYFRDPKIKAVASNLKIMNDGTFLGLIQKFEYLISYQMKRALTLYNIEYIVGGIGSVFRRSVLEQVQYYDTNTVTEDIDLTMKILKNGNKENKVIYGDNIISYTESCLTIDALIRQRSRWKWGRLQTFLKNFEMFFNRDKKYTKLLTCFYLPFAVYGEIAFIFEPILIGYILVITFYYRDLFILISACVVISIYISVNIMADDTMLLKDRLKLILLAPLMYFLFYILSFVEYVALIRSLVKIHKLQKTLNEGVSHWQHVERTGNLDIDSM
jgi:cellulose synthase/poly-beta-1,6-N-acetylglucosamine synthase-like glycosyltransferase